MIQILSFGDELIKLAGGSSTWAGGKAVGGQSWRRNPVTGKMEEVPYVPIPKPPPGRVYKKLHAEYSLKDRSNKPIREWTTLHGPLKPMTERQGYKKYDKSEAARLKNAPTRLPKPIPRPMPKTIPKVPGMKTYNI